ncbi:bromodomain and WD repeat-containing protein 3 isoform X2 [Hydra vulgaris]|uniref:bromodomain and WD repeat-containing protein 3 isoform X2 n=1 Tax=Hydra vulgaris TaxID=6087 RepID=UPI0032EA1399
MNENRSQNLEKELLYVIAKYLENGPCKKAGMILREELQRNQLIFPRLDWKGNVHVQNYEEFDRKNAHLPPQYLVQLIERLNPLVEQCFPSSIKSLKSLLGRGSASLLRTEVTETELKQSSWHSVTRNCAPQLLPPNIKCTSFVATIIGREFSGSKGNLNLTLNCELFLKMSIHKRVLGHLASVYCVLFDRTGSIIVTGADDTLVKLWSTRDCHLIATLRGHSAQITDISINMENTLLASGSLDKTIRVWRLKDTHPVAVLQGHTGMITSLEFCPSADPFVRYLMSTGGDGNICFWPWCPLSKEFTLTPIKFNEKSRPGAQMLCSSFSPGGSFLVTGSSDNFIRIYQLYPDGPEKIVELPNHVDHVDSILYSHRGDRFLSGSRDGTAMIWYYQNSEWHATCLDASARLKGDPKLNDEAEAKTKLKVTMICWNANDRFIITAGTDYVLRVWDSNCAVFVNALKGHTEEVYLLEPHPNFPQIILSAGHDGNIILWDIYKFKKLKLFFNMLEGQGHGAIFDCKFSPDGFSISATDSHGHLLLVGFGSDERFLNVPYEQFFHTDYRPIIRDANNYVIDEQTQTAPHLMYPPFLVDVDGNPHIETYQLLIPGRTAANLPHMRTPQVDENLPPLMAEIAAAEASIVQQRNRNNSVGGLLSPSGVGLGLRESGDVEGVRQQNNSYVSGDISDADAKLWWRRTIIPKNNLYNEKEDEEKRLKQGKNEILLYKKEQIKKQRKFSEEVPDDNRNLRSVSGRGRGRTRLSKVRVPVSYVRASAMGTFDHVMPSSGREVMNISENVSVISESEPEDWQGESSDSTDDSDWIDERLISKEQNELAPRKRRKKKIVSSDVEDNDELEVDVISRESSSDSHTSESSESEENVNDKTETVVVKRSKRVNRGKQKASRTCLPEKVFHKKSKKEICNHKDVPLQENTADNQSNEWILSTHSKKFPYFPQIGDEVYYLRQGHKLYVMRVIERNMYEIQDSRQAYCRYDLAPAELCKLVGISYDVHPIKLCSLKLELIGKKKSSGRKQTITVRFHDIPNVVDFLVLKHIYEESLMHFWKEGDRFRCIIDDKWYFGKITNVSPFEEDFPNSSFLSLTVEWDSGENERVSPWDLEKIPEDCDIVNDDPLTEEDKVLYMYKPNTTDWPYENFEDLLSRVGKGLNDLMMMDFAFPFVSPVDTLQYPTYWSVVAFPTDLQTIKSRLENRFYRRIDALLWEIRQIKTNAVKFNEQGSAIIVDAAYLVKLLCKFCKDPVITDIRSLCKSIPHIYEIKEQNFEESEDENDEDDAYESDAPDWKREAKSLLEFIALKDDAAPFREPVDTELFPDYLSVIHDPIDLSTIRQRLDSNQYDDAESFIRDFQLIFKNSKTYTTDRRSAIFKMTLRLSALFDARCHAVIDAYTRSHENIHWTRGKSKKKANCKKISDSSEDELHSSTRPIKNYKKNISPKRNNHISPVECTGKSLTKSATTTQNGVLRVTRSMNSYINKDSSDSSLSSEENVIPKISISKRTRNSKRRSRVRKRYGYDSDENLEYLTKKTSPKPSLKRRHVAEVDKKSNKKLKLKQNNILQKRSSCRSKSAVNYCEEEFDVFDQISDKETRTDLVDDKSFTESNEDSEESSLKSPVAVSSRGRIRKAAKRFCE